MNWRDQTQYLQWKCVCVVAARPSETVSCVDQLEESRIAVWQTQVIYLKGLGKGEADRMQLKSSPPSEGWSELLYLFLLRKMKRLNKVHCPRGTRLLPTNWAGGARVLPPYVGRLLLVHTNKTKVRSVIHNKLNVLKTYPKSGLVKHPGLHRPPSLLLKTSYWLVLNWPLIGP